MNEREEEWAALMRAANSGDTAAYEALLRQLATALRAIARAAAARTGGAAETEDVVQETLIAIHLKRHTWIESEPIGPWIRAIVRHKLIDALRRRGRHIHVPLDGLEDKLPAEEEGPSFSRRDLARHLDRLPRRQRDVLQAIALDGHSIRETAGRLAISEGAVRVALHRAVTTLAALMQRALS